MTVFEWSISAPDCCWTPEELAQVGTAVQAFLAALPYSGGRVVHKAEIDGLQVFGPMKPTTPPVDVADPFMDRVAEELAEGVRVVRWSPEFQAQEDCSREGCSGMMLGTDLYLEGARSPFFSGWQCSSCPRSQSVPVPS